MPSTTYRRKLRAREALTTRQYIQTLPYAVVSQKGECEIEKIQNYFYSALDMIIQRLEFTNAISTLTNIITSVSSYVEYYKIIDIIEHDLLSTVMNITDGTSSEIIRVRIDYVKSYIDKLPPMCQEPGPVSDMILQILDSLLSSMTSQPIVSTIGEIQTYIQQKYGYMQQMEEIQENILNIVDSIGTGTSPNIISMRVDFVRDLLSKLNVVLG
jgi:hypothetical protein